MRKALLVTALVFGSLVAKADISEELTSVFKIDEATQYSSTLNMRQHRKFGIGTAVGGNLGLVGLNFELNFEDENGAIAGFGTGPGYNSFQVLWKHAFEGDYIAPYATVGYSRWYSTSTGADQINKSGVLKSAVSESDKAAGRFATNFVTASAGLQYNQLSGEFAGTSFFAELTMLAEVQQSVLIPTGSVGAIYYF